MKILPPPITPLPFQQPSTCTFPPVLPPYSYQPAPFPYHLSTLAQCPFASQSGQPSNYQLPPLTQPSLLPQSGPQSSNPQQSSDMDGTKEELT